MRRGGEVGHTRGMGDEPRDRREPAIGDMAERFARGLAAGLSQTEAARVAGYADPRVIAVRLSRREAVREVVRKARTNRIDKLASLSLRELELLIRDRAVSAAVRLNAIKLSLGMAGHTEKPSEDDKSLKTKDVEAMSLGELDAFLAAEKVKRANAAKPVIDHESAQPEANPLEDKDNPSQTEPIIGSSLLIEGHCEPVDPPSDEQESPGPEGDDRP